MNYNPNDHNIYAGLSGMRLPLDEYDFGNDIILSKTYVHVFGPYMAAFKQPKKSGLPHPAPWKSIGGGNAFDIWYEINLPQTTKLFKKIDRLNTIWIITALLRLKVYRFLKVPVISNIKFSDIEQSDSPAYFYPIETIQGQVFYEIDDIIEPNLEGLDWIKQNLKVVGNLFETNEKYEAAFLSIDRSINETRFSMALMTLWGSLEQIFSPTDKQELRYRISLNIASYLEERGSTRQLLFNKVKKLYDARSKAAHGNPTENKTEFLETYELLKRVIIKITEEKLVPDQSVFEKRVLS